jgi:hypothetical protein
MDSWIGGRTLYGASRWPRIAWIKRFLQHDGYLSETSVVADFEAAGFWRLDYRVADRERLLDRGLVLSYAFYVTTIPGEHTVKAESGVRG